MLSLQILSLGAERADGVSTEEVCAHDVRRSNRGGQLGEAAH